MLVQNSSSPDIGELGVKGLVIDNLEIILGWDEVLMYHTGWQVLCYQSLCLYWSNSVG